MVFCAEPEQGIECSHSFPSETGRRRCVLVCLLPFLTTSAQSTDKYWVPGPALCAVNKEERKETYDLVLKKFIVSLGTHICSYQVWWGLWQTGRKHETQSLEGRNEYIQHLKNHARRSMTKCHNGGLPPGSATETERSRQHAQRNWKSLPRGREREHG